MGQGTLASAVRVNKAAADTIAVRNSARPEPTKARQYTRAPGQLVVTTVKSQEVQARSAEVASAP